MSLAVRLWRGCAALRRTACSAHDAHVLRLETLGAPLHFELDRLTFREAAKPVGDDGGVMAEHVLATLLLDETEALRIIEPLDYARCHFRLPRPSSGLDR